MDSQLFSNISSLKFENFRNDDVKKYSVCEITEATLGGPRSVYAPELGVLEDKKLCVTCEQDVWNCPGHFGHIALATPIPHPFYKERIAKFANIFCKNNICGRLLIKKDHAILTDILKKSTEHRLDLFNDLCNKLEQCPHCKEPNGCLKFHPKDGKFFMTYKKNETKFPVTYEEISNIFDNIRVQDLNLVGVSEQMHPKHLLIKNLLVAPPCVRPYVSYDKRVAHDDMTYKYIEIIKANQKLLKPDLNEMKKLNLIDSLDFHISTFMDNTKKKSRDNNKRIIKCINSRISKKQGLIRKYICGKRTDFCARTVIGPEVNCMVDEMVVPREVANKLSYPVTVNNINMKYCMDLVDKGQVNILKTTINVNGVKKEVMCDMKFKAFEVKGTELQDYDKIYRTENGKVVVYDYTRVMTTKGHFELKEGDIIGRGRKSIKAVVPVKRKIELKVGDVIERKLQNGDWVVLNRQPSLRAESMRAKKIRILPGKTFRFNLASTESYNADFDGDKL